MSSSMPANRLSHSDLISSHPHLISPAIVCSVLLMWVCVKNRIPQKPVLGSIMPNHHLPFKIKRATNLTHTHMISIMRIDPVNGGLGFAAHWASGHGVSGAFGNGQASGDQTLVLFLGIFIALLDPEQQPQDAPIFSLLFRQMPFKYARSIHPSCSPF